MWHGHQPCGDPGSRRDGSPRLCPGCAPAREGPELAERPAAAAFFESLDSRNRYAILYRIQDAKRPETRTRRIEKFVAMLEAGETIHPQ